MRHEKIIRREDGSRVKICVSIFVSGYANKHYEYRSHVLTCEKGKRTWKGTYSTNCHNYRSLSMDERRKHEHESQFNAVTLDEIHQAKTELWQSIKPYRYNKLKLEKRNG